MICGKLASKTVRRRDQLPGPCNGARKIASDAMEPKPRLYRPFRVGRPKCSTPKARRYPVAPSAPRTLQKYKLHLKEYDVETGH